MSAIQVENLCAIIEEGKSIIDKVKSLLPSIKDSEEKEDLEKSILTWEDTFFN